MITKTAVGNYLRKQPSGDVGMYRNGFKDGVAWALAKSEAEKAWAARDLSKCKCDHNETCEHCNPPNLRHNAAVPPKVGLY